MDSRFAITETIAMLKHVALVVGFAALSSGCCTAATTLLPKGDQAVVVATSASANCCLKRAKEEAQEYCALQSKGLNVIEATTDYQGVDKDVKTAAAVVGALGGPQANLNTNEDYRTELTFKCEGAAPITK